MKENALNKITWVTCVTKMCKKCPSPNNPNLKWGTWHTNKYVVASKINCYPKS
jgi:hypothetical protein